MTGRAASEPTWPAEPGAARLYRAVRAACASGDGLAERLDLGLAAALSFLAADVDLSRDLTVLGGDAESLTAQRRWVASFAELLRGAAGDRPGASPGPRSREPFLVDGIRFQIGRRVRAGETARLQELHPELLSIVLAYYRDGKPAGSAPSGRASALAGVDLEARFR